MNRRFFAAHFAAALSLVVATTACNSPKQAGPMPTTEPIAQRSTNHPIAAFTASTHPAKVADAKTILNFLASDELEGRGIGTKGLDRAGDYLVEQFQNAGLRTAPGMKNYFQEFEVNAGAEVGKGTTLTAGPDRTFDAGKDFIPLSFSAEGKFSGPVVFAGYGVSSTEHDYDDYKDLDVKDKLVMVMRFEPHDEKGKSQFTGDDWSTDAHLATKAQQALDHGAAGVLLVTPPDHHEDEGLMPLARAPGQQRKIPVVQIKATVADELLKRGGAPDLKTLQENIDTSRKPASLALADVKVDGNIQIDRKKVKVRNIVGYLPGSGPRAKEYLVVGAHYDHLGYGGINSLKPTTRAIHNGADDNASGTTALVELAARFANGPTPARSMIFVAFTAEEEGILGSDHFVDHPPVPLSDIVAMLNFDMVGRLKDETVQVGGVGTAEAFSDIIKKADDDSPLKVKEIGKGGLGPSDHMAFGLKKVPCMHLFSGLHSDYHRPSDDADKINFEGLSQIIEFACDVTKQMLAMPRQTYVSKFDSQAGHPGTPSRSRVTLGVVPDYTDNDDTGGVRISGTSPDSPAAKAGLKEGDCIVKFDDKNIDTLYDLSEVLAKAKPGQTVKLKVKRGEKTVDVEATLVERK